MIVAAVLVAVAVALVPLRRRPRGFPTSETRVLEWPNRVDGVWASVAVAVVIGFVARTPLLVVPAPIVGLGWRRQRSRRRRQSARRNSAVAVTAFVDVATEGMRSGTSLTNAIAHALVLPGADAGEVRHPRLEHLSDAIAGGRSLAAAADEIVEHENLSTDECLVFTTITALLQSGGAALDALERVGDTLRERQSSEEDLRTQAQQAFSSAAVMSALPIVFAGAAALADAEVARFYRSTWLGAACVAVSLLFMGVGWEWQQRLLRRAR